MYYDLPCSGDEDSLSPPECLVSLEATEDCDSGDDADVEVVVVEEAAEHAEPEPPCCFLGLRFLVWMPSLRMLMGRFTPCNLKYSPQALHTGSPSLLRRHSVVVRVPQLVQHSPKRRVAVCNHKS